jgi:hypothetical protein
LSPWRRYLLNTLLFLVILAALAGLTWINYQYSLQNPGGSDSCAGRGRAFLMTGESPSEQTSQEIQRLFYGRWRSRKKTRCSSSILYSIFVFAPFAMIADYSMARAAWMTLLEVSIILITVAGIYLSRWKLRPIYLGVMLLFALFLYYNIRSLINANAAVLVGLFVVLALLAIRTGQDPWAGLFLVLATIKPQVVVLLILYILIWSISERRYLILWSFLGNLALAVAITSLLIPDWTWQNLRQVIAYPSYTLPGTPGAIFATWMPGVGLRLGWALTVVLVTTLIWEWRASLGKDLRWFFWTACFTLVATTMVGIRTAPRITLLLPAIILVSPGTRWGISGA